MKNILPISRDMLSGYQRSLVMPTTGSRCESGESPAKAGVQTSFKKKGAER
jgi:hypothetical protein